MEMKMITFATRRRKGIALTATLALFLSVICGSAHAAGNATAEATASEQQNNRITGKVVNENGNAIAGASVISVQDPTNGVLTSADGTFALTVPANSSVVVKFLGYDNTTISVGTRTNLNITLKDGLNSSATVTILGAAPQDKTTVTSAVSTLEAKDIQRSMSTTAGGALVGKIAGLNFRQTSGKPGDGINLKIRNSERSPLYIIDGVPADEGKFNNTDFTNIETLSVLKDGAAAAYGSRGASGVVIITTKRGKLGEEASVSVSGYYGWSKLVDQLDVANANEYSRFWSQSQTLDRETGGANANYTYPKSQEQYWKAGKDRRGDLTIEDPNLRKDYRSFDWKDYIFVTAPQNYVKASVTGGSDNTNYYISVSNLDAQHMIRNYGGFMRQNYQVNIDTQVTKRLKVMVTLDGYVESRHNPGIPGGDDTNQPRYAMFRNKPFERPYANDNPLYLNKLDDMNTNFAVYSYETSGYLRENWRNHNYQVGAKYNIMEGLNFTARAGYTLADKVLDVHEKPWTVYTYDVISDKYTPTEHADHYRERAYEKNIKYFSNLELSFNRRFGEHGVSAVAMFETQQEQRPSTSFTAQPTTNTIQIMSWDEVKAKGGFSDVYRELKRAGLAFSANYDYAQRYLFGVTGRYDASSMYAADERWGFFPSASVGWRISEENFWKNSKLDNVFNEMKFRASYGIMGIEDNYWDNDNNNARRFAYVAGYNYNDGRASFDGTKSILGARARGIPSILTWRKMKKLNFGLDMQFVGGKLSASVDYFDNNETGIPAKLDGEVLPREVGFDVPDRNLYNRRHRGMDGVVSWVDKIGEVNYSASANFTYARFIDWNRPQENRFNNSWDEYKTYKYKRFGHLTWGKRVIGRFKDWNDVATYGVDNDERGNRRSRPGDFKFEDVNKDGVINGEDDRPIGYRRGHTPNLSFGINLFAAWRGINLSADFTGGGFQTYTMEWELCRPFQNNANFPKESTDSWRLSDPWDENSKLIPGYFPTMVFAEKDWRRYDSNNTFFTTNVTYIKLKNIELGYDLPKAWLDRAKITQVRVYVSAQNLFSIHNIPLKGLDPETEGTTGYAYPTPRVISIGANLKF